MGFFTSSKKNIVKIKRIDSAHRSATKSGKILVRGTTGVRPRIQTNSNLSRQVLEDSYKLHTDITRKS